MLRNFGIIAQQGERLPQLNLCRIGVWAAAQTLWTETETTPLQAKALELLGLQA